MAALPSLWTAWKTRALDELGIVLILPFPLRLQIQVANRRPTHNKARDRFGVTPSSRFGLASGISDISPVVVGPGTGARSKRRCSGFVLVTYGSVSRHAAIKALRSSTFG